MPDLKLYPGETNPADVRLRNPVVGVSASVGAQLTGTSAITCKAVGKARVGAQVGATSVLVAQSKGQAQPAAQVVATGLLRASAQGKGKEAAAPLTAGASLATIAAKGKAHVGGVLGAVSSLHAVGYVAPSVAAGFAATSSMSAGAVGLTAALPGGGDLWGFENPIAAEIRAPGLAARAILAPIKAVGRSRDNPLPVAPPVVVYVPAPAPPLAPPPVVVTTPALVRVGLGASASMQAAPRARARAGAPLVAVARTDAQAQGLRNDDLDIAAALLLLREAA